MFLFFPKDQHKMKPDALGRQDHVHTRGILKIKYNYITGPKTSSQHKQYKAYITYLHHY